MRPTVLSATPNRRLADVRNAVLARAGYAVRPAFSAEEAMRLIATAHYDLVLIGHGFTRVEKLQILEMAAYRGMPTLLLMQGGSDLDLPATAHTEVLDGPEGLLSALEATLRRKS